MIPLLADGVDLVTASPYHPLGLVRNVPPVAARPVEIAVSACTGSCCTSGSPRTRAASECTDGARRRGPGRQHRFPRRSRDAGLARLARLEDRRIPDDARGPHDRTVEDEGPSDHCRPPGTADAAGLPSLGTAPHVVMSADRGTSGGLPARRPGTATGSHVGIVGGGMLGLGLAAQLVEAGPSRHRHRGVAALGGLAAADGIGGVTWDRFYHVTLLSDCHLRALLEDIGLGDQLHWRTTRTGFFTDGRLVSMSSSARFPDVSAARALSPRRDSRGRSSTPRASRIRRRSRRSRSSSG